MNITEEKKQNLTKITKGMSDLVFSNALIAGKIKNADGIMIYEPFKSKQEFIEAVNHGQEIGYNTHTMGRGIFTVNEDGSITNYKGVDSHLEDKDSYAVQFQKLCGKKTEMSKIIDVTNTSSYGMSIIIEGENIELRTRGASELLNLINEKDKTTKLQAQDNAHLIKIENLEELIPFSAQFCEKYFLPKKVKLTPDYLNSLRQDENNYGVYAIECMNKFGMDTSERAQLMSEYFTDDFLKDKGVEKTKQLEEAIKKHDQTYPLGAYFGQLKRKLDCPFRILDLEYLLRKENKTEEDIKQIESILDYMDTKSNDFLLEFAEINAKNVAGLMNCEYAFHNYKHRQDFSLSGELCDEAYDDMSEALKYVKEHENEHSKTYWQNMHEKYKYLFQFYYFAGNMKVIEDAYKVVGREINPDYKNMFIDTFITSLTDTPHASKEENIEQILNFRQLDSVLDAFEESQFEHTAAKPYIEYFKEINYSLKEKWEDSKNKQQLEDSDEEIQINEFVEVPPQNEFIQQTNDTIENNQAVR